MGLRIFNSMDTSATGLRAQRQRLEVIAENLANAEVTRGPDGEPYRRKVVVSRSREPETRRNIRAPYGPDEFSKMLRTSERHFREAPASSQVQLPLGSQVEVEIDVARAAFRTVFDPGHPDADENGYVLMPNVNPIEEMVDLIAATRAYEANVSAIQAAKDMFRQAIEI